MKSAPIKNLTKIFAAVAAVAQLTACTTAHQPASPANTTTFYPDGRIEQPAGQQTAANFTSAAEARAAHEAEARAAHEEAVRRYRTNCDGHGRGSFAYAYGGGGQYYNRDSWPIEKPVVRWGNIEYQGRAETGCHLTQTWQSMNYVNGEQTYETRVVGTYPSVGKAECMRMQGGGVFTGIANAKEKLIMSLGGTHREYSRGGWR